MFNKLTPNLMVDDVNRSVDFYRDVLGFDVAATAPCDGVLDWAMLQHDAVEITVQRRSSLGAEIPALRDVAIGGSLTFYTGVAGLDRLKEQLRGHGEIVLDLTYEFAFKDPNGYIWAFSEDGETDRNS